MAPPKRRPSPVSTAVAGNLHSADKRFKPSLTVVQESAALWSVAKVKIESAATTNAAAVLHADVVEIQKNDHRTQYLPAVPTTSTTTEDVEVVGTLNHTRLPHMRQHCTEKTFLASEINGCAERRKLANGEFCSDCYCYVCDVPVQECKSWMVGDAFWNKNYHCNATDQGMEKHFWAAEREKAKKKRIPHYRHKCPVTVFDKRPQHYGRNYYDEDLDSEAYCSDYDGSASLNVQTCPQCQCFICDVPASTCAHWSGDAPQHRDAHPYSRRWSAVKEKALLSIFGPGPFSDKDHEAVGTVKNLTKCRHHCGYYSRLYGDPGKVRAPGCLDWCHACGRVASADDLGKIQSTPLKCLPTTSDLIPLGIKETSFGLHPHDPRKMTKYAERWAEHGWIYDEDDAAEELFLHRFGTNPKLPMIMSSIPVLETIPADGNHSVEYEKKTHRSGVGQ